MTYTHGPDPYTPIMPPSLPTLRIRGSSRNAPLSVMSPPKSSNLSQLACRQITNPKLLYALLPIPATRHHHFPSLFPVLMPIQPIHTISLLLTTFTNAISVHKTYLHKPERRSSGALYVEPKFYRLPESPKLSQCSFTQAPEP